MIIVSDASPVVALLHIEQLLLLEKLYKKVIIPNEVFNELLSAKVIDERLPVNSHLSKLRLQ